MNFGAMEGWPFPSDFRDPSEAWDLQNKLMFFALYTGFWSCVVLAVFLYTRLRSRCSCCRRVRSPMKRQSNGFGDVLKMSEAFGDMPPFPESKARQKQACSRVSRSPTQVAKIVCECPGPRVVPGAGEADPDGDGPGVAPRGKDCGHLPGVELSLVRCAQMPAFLLRLSVSLLAPAVSLARASSENSVPARRGARRSRPAVGLGARTARPASGSQAAWGKSEKSEPRMRGTNGEIVALSLPRSSAQVVSILGALLAGAGYLPMDDTGPEA